MSQISAWSRATFSIVYPLKTNVVQFITTFFLNLYVVCVYNVPQIFVVISIWRIIKNIYYILL